MQLVKTSFKLRYNNSFLGFIWVFIKPFVNFLVNYLVWTTLFPNREEFFALKLMLGIMLWTFLNEGVIFGMNGLLDKAGVILKVNFPRYTAIIASTLMSAVNFLVNIVLFFVIFAIYNISTGGNIIGDITLNGTVISLLGIIFSACTIYTICLAVSYFLSIIVIRFRDLQHILELFFSIAFWFTPVLVTTAVISDKTSLYYKIIDNNPIGWILDFARNTVIYSNFDGLLNVVLVLFIAVVVSFLGSYYFERKVKSVAEYF